MLPIDWRQIHYLFNQANLTLFCINVHALKKLFFSVCRVYVEDLLAIGVGDGAAELQPLKYRVIREDQSYCGEIDVGITFKVTFE